jgi:hypothetical protein
VGRTPNVPDELRARPFSLDEARAAGISLSALRGKSWQRLGYKLYRWNNAPEDTWSLIQAFRRDLPESAVFANRTAAWMHRLDVEPGNPFQVAVPPQVRLSSRAGLELRRAQCADGEVVTIKGVRATSLNRTLLDLCSRSSAPEALVALDMALRAELTDRRLLIDYAAQVHGRSGASRLRDLAAVAAPAESPMETRLRWLLIRGGLPMPEVQSHVYNGGGQFVGRADLYYPSAHLVIEFDGGNHRTRLVADDRRQNSIVDAGYRILRFTSADVYGRPDAVIALVRGYLSGR